MYVCMCVCVCVYVYVYAVDAERVCGSAWVMCCDILCVCLCVCVIRRFVVKLICTTSWSSMQRKPQRYNICVCVCVCVCVYDKEEHFGVFCLQKQKNM